MATPDPLAQVVPEMLPRSTVPVVLILIAGSATGCQPLGDTANSQKPVHCTVVADGPKKTETGKAFTARARFRCAPPGAQPLSITIRIEQRIGDTERWRTVAKEAFTLRGEDTVADELKYNSREAALSCRTGSFRTVVDWSRTSRGAKAGDNLVSGAVKDPCKKLFAS
jgi:hypothetical protein